ncbi:MAG TPA: hypothetical protein GXZ89_03390 [Fastidiosipila sp.]|nr:hypothetical protein [Fastidiosipila sp.]
MKKRQKQVNVWLLRIVIMLSLITLSIAPVTAEEEPFAPSVSVTPRIVSAEESFVVRVSLRGQETKQVSRLQIDASELGIETKIPVDLELFSQTVPVRFDTKPGNKTLHLIVETDDGLSTEIPFEVEVREVPADEPRWDESVIYFLLTDRFADGDPSNNDPHGIGYDRDHPETYQGGDFQGIIDNLDYLDALGINMVWITPIVDNIEHDRRHGMEGSQYGYHGYWAKDFETIDEHWGDLETFHDLIDEAAEKDIRLMIDVVLNHAGYGMKASDDGNGIDHFPSHEDRQRFVGMLREDPAPHTVTGELMGLPDFITEDPGVRKALVGWQSAWIEKSMTVAGNRIAAFRVDTVKHADATLWRALKKTTTLIDPGFKLLGEWYGASIDNDGRSLLGGGMDALLDFAFKDIAQAFIRGDLERAERQLNHRNNKMDNTRLMAQFLSSHDEDGFLLTRAGQDEGLFKVAVSLQLTAKGIPVIYYGEEIGLSGKTAGNMDRGEFSENRYMFDWDKVEGNDLLDHYQIMVGIRNDFAPIFARGDRQTLLAENDPGVSVFARSLDDEAVLVALNRSGDPQLLWFEGSELESLIDLYGGARVETMELHGKEGVLLQIPAATDGGTAVLSLGNIDIADLHLELVDETLDTGD